MRFAVSVCVGAGGHARDLRSILRLSWHLVFSIYYAGLWMVCRSLGFTMDTPFDQWIAFVLLASSAWRWCIQHSIRKSLISKKSNKGSSLVVLSVATSIDAFVIGLSLAFMNISVWYPASLSVLLRALYQSWNPNRRRFNRMLEERLKRQEDWLLSDSACVCLFLDKTNALHNVKVKALFQTEKNSLIVRASFYT